MLLVFIILTCSEDALGSQSPDTLCTHHLDLSVLFLLWLQLGILKMASLTGSLIILLSLPFNLVQFFPI